MKGLTCVTSLCMLWGKPWGQRSDGRPGKEEGLGLEPGVGLGLEESTPPPVQDSPWVQGQQGWWLSVGLPMSGCVQLCPVSEACGGLGACGELEAGTCPGPPTREKLVLLMAGGGVARHSLWSAAGWG